MGQSSRGPSSRLAAAVIAGMLCYDVFLNEVVVFLGFGGIVFR